LRDVGDTHNGPSPREAGVPERTKLANLFAAIGNATNEAIRDMPEFSDERVRRQMMHTFAAVGGLVMYADMLEHSTMKASSQASSESSAAIIQLGRALSRRLEVKDA
jgi:hypothetical protein